MIHNDSLQIPLNTLTTTRIRPRMDVYGERDHLLLKIQQMMRSGKRRILSESKKAPRTRLYKILLENETL